jgi:hypothetical protein
MKKQLTILVGLVLVTLFAACKRDAEIIDPVPSDTTQASTGAITPVGVPTGTAVTATIGAVGGTLESEDKRIRVEIPAGALTADQTISIQALDKNNCPGGTGSAFRLMPHGLTFAKPATITYHYDEADMAGTHPAFLQVAFQNDKHIWQNVTVTNIDTASHAIAVKTTHFSDWALFKRLDLVPGEAAIDPGKSIKLRLMEVAPAKNGDLPIPNVNTRDELKKYVKSWTWPNSVGTLVHTYDEGQYYAPETIPSINPVPITVVLDFPPIKDEAGHTFTDLRLVSSIFVAPEGISYQIDGGGWQTFPGGANLQPSQSVMLGNNGNDYVSLTWPGKNPGVYRWVLGTNVAFNLEIGPQLYQHIYVENKKPKVSGGTLIVQRTSLGTVLGTFTVTPSGWIRPSTPLNPIGTANIKGVFRLRDVN